MEDKGRKGYVMQNQARNMIKWTVDSETRGQRRMIKWSREEVTGAAA